MFLFYADPILIAAAVIPAIALLVYVYKKDRLEREPKGLLLSLILFGIIATSLALITERLGSAALPYVADEDTVGYNVLLYFVVVGCSEEGFKYLLLKDRTWTNPNFNCQFDGLVYAVFVSLGFALWENISYVLMYGIGTAVVRAVTAVPGHACFGVFMGVWYGAAKRYAAAGMERKSRTCRRLAFILPMLMHGAYDYIAAVEYENDALIFVVFVLAMFTLAYSIVNRASKQDKYID